MSNDEYQQKQFFEDSWEQGVIKGFKKLYYEEAERLFYTAQEGSTLDKIWKGEYNLEKQIKNINHEH